MSNLLVQNIKHTNNTTAQTIDTSGRTTVSIMNNDSTYRSDGGAVTQNLVQGLAKVWIRASSSAVDADSFNVSSTTDNTTGDYSYDFTNSMSNDTYCAMGTCKSTVPRIASVYTTATTQFEIRYHNESGSDTDTANSNMINGDLA